MIVPPCVVTICCGVDVNLLALLAGVRSRRTGSRFHAASAETRERRLSGPPAPLLMAKYSSGQRKGSKIAASQAAPHSHWRRRW